MQDVKEELKEKSLVAAFSDHESAVLAATALDAAGIPPDHVGVVAENVRQAREAAGMSCLSGRTSPWHSPCSARCHSV